ncbi:hypothetical protein PPYR_09819 [Photinus pyralis]|uniref:DAGKc domain-containing protein n=1 Tax=Photinus pyralis TaxID=7054 RepID=A0A1Y1MCI8_PHOPY|nr:sphingosine kinase 2-like [Photinus pyralis]KAB0795758.1 hypothetical protein PPYR_09819 [Photinus pyralis]
MAGTIQQSGLDDAQNKTLLEETFYVLKKKNSVFRVKLTNSGLHLIKENENQVKTQIIPVKDIIGCRCLRSKKERNSCACQSLSHGSSLKVVDEKSGDHDDADMSAYLYIYAYILRSNQNKRDRTTITLRFRSFDRYDENYKEAQRWRMVLKKLIRGDEVSMVNISDYNIVPVKEDRRLLVLLSPKSGSGKGRMLFQKKIVPILQEAEIPFDLHITQYANFAREFVRNCQLYQWTGIIVVGGDGLLFEVINGIFERWDWAEAIKHITFGIIPGGTGNGLARSIAHCSGEPYNPPALPAAIAATRNFNEMMDLVRIETTSQILFSFLSVGWGILSDIDIESEGLRALGEPRYVLWSLARIIGLKSYSGKVYYLPADATITPFEKKYEPLRSKSKVDLPSEVLLETTDTRQRLDSWYSAASRRSAYFSTTGSSYQSTNESAGEEPRMYGPASQLPCITAALPSNWKCLAGRFIMVHASYQTHIGTDLFVAPQSKLNDGLIWLLVIHASASRSQVVQFLLRLSSGSHINSNGWDDIIKIFPVRAFRIEPEVNEAPGYMTVDGEVVEYGPIQAEIFPGLIKVMVP